MVIEVTTPHVTSTRRSFHCMWNTLMLYACLLMSIAWLLSGCWFAWLPAYLGNHTEPNGEEILKVSQQNIFQYLLLLPFYSFTVVLKSVWPFRLICCVWDVIDRLIFFFLCGYFFFGIFLFIFYCCSFVLLVFGYFSFLHKCLVKFSKSLLPAHLLRFVVGLASEEF